MKPAAAMIPNESRRSSALRRELRNVSDPSRRASLGGFGSDAACKASTQSASPSDFAVVGSPNDSFRPGLESRLAELSALQSPFVLALDALGERLRIQVLWQLFWGARPFGDLMRTLSGVSKKDLRHELVALERSGLVRRVVRESDNKRWALYALTETGQTVKPLLAMMYDWGLAIHERESRIHPSPAARD